MTLETRTAAMFPDADYELRAGSDGFEFEGYAAVFGKLSKPMRFPGIGGGRRFQERVEPGAFTDTLAGNPDVSLRVLHNMGTLPLASTGSGSMTLEQDGIGLHVRATLPDDEWGRPVRNAIASGRIRGMSFTFLDAKDSWQQDGGMRIRTLHAVGLGPEVSVADGSLAAYPDTIAAVRAVADALRSNPDEVIAELIDAVGSERLSPEQREQLVSIVNKNTDTPVVDKATVEYLEGLRRRAYKSTAA